MELLYFYLLLHPAFIMTAVGVGFVGQCNVTHQGNVTAYNIQNAPTNDKCLYYWADSNDTVKADDVQPRGGSVLSSSHSSLTMSECLEKVCVTNDCQGQSKFDHTLCCHTKCIAAPDPVFQANPTNKSDRPTSTKELPPSSRSWIVPVVLVIAVGIVVLIVVVLIEHDCRKKKISFGNWFKRACSSKEPPDKEGSSKETAGRPEDVPMISSV